MVNEVDRINGKWSNPLQRVAQWTERELPITEDVKGKKLENTNLTDVIQERNLQQLPIYSSQETQPHEILNQPRTYVQNPITLSKSRRISELLGSTEEVVTSMPLRTGDRSFQNPAFYVPSSFRNQPPIQHPRPTRRRDEIIPQMQSIVEEESYVEDHENIHLSSYKDNTQIEEQFERNSIIGSEMEKHSGRGSSRGGPPGRGLPGGGPPGRGPPGGGPPYRRHSETPGSPHRSHHEGQQRNFQGGPPGGDPSGDINEQERPISPNLPAHLEQRIF